jgi:radical SAM-linked protein
MKARKSRLRISFFKRGRLKYTSHLELVRAWERSLRRAGVALAYSRGFNPRPRIQLAAALPLGHTGEEELMDVWVEERPRLKGLARALQPALPAGLGVKEVREVPLRAAALQTQVVASEYRVTVEWEDGRSAAEEQVGRVLAAVELPHVRRGKRYDLRPLIERLWVAEDQPGAAGELVLGMVLAAREGATARPEAVVEVLGLEGRCAKYSRLRLKLRQG